MERWLSSDNDEIKEVRRQVRLVPDDVEHRGIGGGDIRDPWHQLSPTLGHVARCMWVLVASIARAT